MYLTYILRYMCTEDICIRKICVYGRYMYTEDTYVYMYTYMYMYILHVNVSSYRSHTACRAQQRRATCHVLFDNTPLLFTLAC